MFQRALSGSGGSSTEDFEELMVGRSSGIIINNNVKKTGTNMADLLSKLTDYQSANISGGRFQLILSKTKYIVGISADNSYTNITTINAGTAIPLGGWETTQCIRFYNNNTDLT